MTAARIGLMGFGRIGRNVFRMVADHPTLEVAAIADIADPEGLTYLLKYDSIHGRFHKRLEETSNGLVMDGRVIPYLDAREPGDAHWGDLGVDIVVQATGSYRSAGWCRKHLDVGAKRVILASTPEDLSDDIPMLITGINDDVLSESTDMVAMGSNTSNALAPILRILDDAFGLERAFFTSVHAMTNSQRLADVPTAGFRQSRAAGENIIPQSSNSPEILMSVMPDMRGKLSGTALNVPVADGSTVDLVAEVRDTTDITTLNAAVRTAVESKYSSVTEYSADPIVSSDVRQSTFSGIYDSLAAMVMGGTLVKTITWYNNGWGYSARVVEAAERMAEHTLGVPA
ncbi:MAG: glyceraldehyde 3-phosphate dehydrogenase NAD-binding domain-containing protein [Acidimicrobiia bacterium]